MPPQLTHTYVRTETSLLSSDLLDNEVFSAFSCLIKTLPLSVHPQPIAIKLVHEHMHELT